MSGAFTSYAHSLPSRPPLEWETLEAHSAKVAQIAASFAVRFGAGDWGYLLGLWHDLGKGSKEFQGYLRSSCDPDAGEDERALGRVDHSTFGAQYAARTIGGHFGQLLAFCIAGHHAGLADASSDDESEVRSTLHARLNKNVPSVPMPLADNAVAKLKLPFVITSRETAGFRVAFLARMLFSTLIDADRTATESFCDPRQASERNGPKPSIAQLGAALDAFLSEIQAKVEPTTINRLRAGVLADCLAASSHKPGFFSLNVPTGGGKTYASLAFALHHAQAHGLSRVVVAMPFTSIIEQTADAYRKALGSLSETGLIEHHSNIDPKKETRQNSLAAENWDVPLIVTTNVQLYESLFAAGTTPCRKLHRLANSVVVLDEAQTIPVELLHPTLMALKELVACYGCTVVLCTATQPALERRSNFDIGIEGVRPIIRDSPALFAALRRVEVVRLGKLTDDELVERLAKERSALCVVNTRPHAAKLYDALVRRCDGSDCFHLSTFMCAQHRRDKLKDIRLRLKDKKPCRLISTQLIEAGVDIDFPTVFRAPAGFDAIAQAAGRCNREGLLQQEGRAALGRVYLFETESPPPPGLQRAAAQCAAELIGRHNDPMTLNAVEEYFRLFYWTQQHRWDKEDVLGALADELKHPDLQLKFRTAALRYKIIREEQTPILVPYNREARGICSQMMRGEPSDYRLLRAAQRYLVNVREAWLTKLAANCVINQHESGLWWLANEQAYSPEKGLSLEAVGFDPEMLHV